MKCILSCSGAYSEQCVWMSVYLSVSSFWLKSYRHHDAGDLRMVVTYLQSSAIPTWLIRGSNEVSFSTRFLSFIWWQAFQNYTKFIMEFSRGNLKWHIQTARNIWPDNVAPWFAAKGQVKFVMLVLLRKLRGSMTGRASTSCYYKCT
jgi:hypothetical protein